MSWGDKKMGDFFKYFPVFPKFSITGTKKNPLLPGNYEE